jgi:DNA-binding ferritin-like protein
MGDIEEIKNKYKYYILYKLVCDDEFNIYAQHESDPSNIIDVYINSSLDNPKFKQHLTTCITRFNTSVISIDCPPLILDGKTKKINVTKLFPSNDSDRNGLFDLLEEKMLEEESGGGKKQKTSKKSKKMMKKRRTVRKNKQKKGGYTPKNKERVSNQSNNNQVLEKFQREITLVFFEILIMIKLFHWKTHSYATHKATDELYSSFNENMDKFIEVLLGKSGSRIHLSNQTNISLEEMDSQERLKQKIESFKSYLVGLDNNPAIKLMSNTDLLNIRDEILGNMNQFLYLLTFK